MPAPTKQTKRRFGLLDFIRILLVLVILCALGVIAYRLWDYKTGTDRYDQLQQQAVQPVEETQEEGFVPLDIDFDALREEGPDIIGWIDFDSVEISYPIVYSGDNSYYLRRLWDGSYNQAGTLFLEGNNQSLDDLHAIVYGHNMLDGSMFKPLLQYLTPNFRQTHQDIYLELNGAQYRYQVIAALETNTRSPVYTYTDLNNTAEMEDFRAALLEETSLDAVPQAEGYLTLPTCNTQGGDSRVLVIAALVEEVQR